MVIWVALEREITDIENVNLGIMLSIIKGYEKNSLINLVLYWRIVFVSQ